MWQPGDSACDFQLLSLNNAIYPIHGILKPYISQIYNREKIKALYSQALFLRAGNIFGLFLSGEDMLLSMTAKQATEERGIHNASTVSFACYLCLDPGDFVMLAFSASSKSFVVSSGSSLSTV